MLESRRNTRGRAENACFIGEELFDPSLAIGQVCIESRPLSFFLRLWRCRKTNRLDSRWLVCLFLLWTFLCTMHASSDLDNAVFILSLTRNCCWNYHGWVSPRRSSTANDACFPRTSVWYQTDILGLTFTFVLFRDVDMCSGSQGLAVNTLLDFKRVTLSTVEGWWDAQWFAGKTVFTSFKATFR